MLSWLVALSFGAGGAGGAPPNIIFHLVDDWGSYDASFRMTQLGRDVDIPTPHIDGLHDGGVGFENYYVQVSPALAALGTRYAAPCASCNTH